MMPFTLIWFQESLEEKHDYSITANLLYVAVGNSIYYAAKFGESFLPPLTIV